MIEFAVIGTPIPQGSKVGYNRGGQVRLVDMSNKKTKTKPAGRLKRWKADVSARAAECMREEPWAGPVVVECEFLMPRSKSHFTSKGALTKRAPMVPTGDLDKLVRAVGDALSKVVYRDDVQVVGFGGTSKRFAQGMTGGVTVRVREVAL